MQPPCPAPGPTALPCSAPSAAQANPPAEARPRSALPSPPAARPTLPSRPAAPSPLPPFGASRPALLLAAVLLLIAACPGEDFVGPPTALCEAGPVPERIRVVSYNIHAGTDSSLDRIAEELERLDGDVVALQEVDRFVSRTGSVDQAAVLAGRLGYAHAFAGAMERGGGEFGVALLSRLPFASAERVDLPWSVGMEPRAGIDAELCVGGETWRVVSVHTDVMPWAHGSHGSFLADLVREDVGRGVIVAGDLNATPDSGTIGAITEAGLTDVIAVHDEGITYTGPYARRLDYLLLDETLNARLIEARVDMCEASDHRPIWVDLTP